MIRAQHSLMKIFSLPSNLILTKLILMIMPAIPTQTVNSPLKEILLALNSVPTEMKLYSLAPSPQMKMVTRSQVVLSKTEKSKVLGTSKAVPPLMMRM